MTPMDPKSHRVKMARAFKQEFSEKLEKIPSRTWMHKVMDWIDKKDMVSLARFRQYRCCR